MQGKRGGKGGPRGGAGQWGLPAGEYTPLDARCVAAETSGLHTKEKRMPEDRFAVCVDGTYDTFDSIAKCYREYPFRSLTRGKCGSSNEYADQNAGRDSLSTDAVRARAARYGIPYEPKDDECFQREVGALALNNRRVPEDRFEVCVDGTYDTYDNVAKCYREYPSFESYAKGPCATAVEAVEATGAVPGTTPATFDSGVCTKAKPPNSCRGSVTYDVGGARYTAGVRYVDVTGPRGGRVHLAVDRRTGACRDPCAWHTDDGASGTFSKFEPRGGGSPRPPPGRKQAPVGRAARAARAPKGTPAGTRTRATYTPCGEGPGRAPGCNGADGVLRFTTPWKNSGRIVYVKNLDPTNAPPRNIMVYLLGPDPGIREATNSTFEWTAPGRRGTLVPSGGPAEPGGADFSSDTADDGLANLVNVTATTTGCEPDTPWVEGSGQLCFGTMTYGVVGDYNVVRTFSKKVSQYRGKDKPVELVVPKTIRVDPAKLAAGCAPPNGCNFQGPDGVAGNFAIQGPALPPGLTPVTSKLLGCTKKMGSNGCSGTATYEIGGKKFSKISRFRSPPAPPAIAHVNINPDGTCGTPNAPCRWYNPQTGATGRYSIEDPPPNMLAEKKTSDAEYAEDAEYSEDAEYAGVETGYAKSGWQPSGEIFYQGEAARRVFDDGFYPRPQSTSFVAPPPPSNRKRVWTGVKVDQDAVACKHSKGNCKSAEWTAGGAKKKEVALFDRPNVPFGTQIYVEFPDGGECGSEGRACGWYGPGGETGTLSFDRLAGAHVKPK